MQTSDFKSYKLWEPIVVEWIDILVDREAHDPGEYIENYKPCVRKTAGFFLGVKHSHLFICETDDREARTGDDAESINAFPLCVIQKVIKIQ